MSGLNARQLRNSQLIGGIELEPLACRRALAEAEARDQELRAAIARDEGAGLPTSAWRRSTALPR